MKTYKAKRKNHFPKERVSTDEIPGYSPSTLHQVSYLFYCHCLNYSFLLVLAIKKKKKETSLLGASIGSNY